MAVLCPLGSASPSSCLEEPQPGGGLLVSIPGALDEQPRLEKLQRAVPTRSVAPSVANAVETGQSKSDYFFFFFNSVFIYLYSEIELFPEKQIKRLSCKKR